MSCAHQKRNIIPFTYRNRYFKKVTTPEILDEVCKFKFLPSDIVVSTYPRSGTTFLQEIVWQIKHRNSTVKDEKVDLTITRMPYLEFNYELHPGLQRTPLEILESQRNYPYRLIKTHVPYEFIKDNFEEAEAKMIVVMRNCKDCLVSNFFMDSNSPSCPFQGTFDEYFELFINGKVNNGNYFQYNLEWWELRNRENVLIVFYEDLLMNMMNNLEKISHFLGEKLTENEVDKIIHNCSFLTMYNNPKVNFRINDSFSFLRKGIVGDWKNNLTEKQNKTLNEIIEGKLEKAGLKFIYE